MNISDLEERTGFKLTLPPVAASHLISQYEKADVVLEYGSAGSTFGAMEQGVKTLYAVESDKDWFERLAQNLAEFYPNVDTYMIHADIGPTKAWGHPQTDEFRNDFPNYAFGVWDKPDFTSPNVVLVDGRFRAACVFAVMKHATKITSVLFDDYGVRPHFHWIEDILGKAEMHGRMAHFEVRPGPIPEGFADIVDATFYDTR